MATWWPCIVRLKFAIGRSWARLEKVTVKRYKQDGSVVWLLPENADFEPIRVNLKEDPLIIEGVVVGVLRRGDSLMKKGIS
jgi:hypothetical protein